MRWYESAMLPALIAIASFSAPTPQEARPPSGQVRRAVEPRVLRDVLYRPTEGAELKLDAYLPMGNAPHGAVLLVHGGSWKHGKRQDMHEFAERLAHQELACFTVSYRLAPEHRFPAQIEDCLYAVQFLRAHAAEYHIDPDRIGALGLSAGGHLVDLLGVLDERRDEHAGDPVLRQSSRVQCVVSYFGPALLAKTPANGIDTRPPPELFGDAPDSAYAAASPLNF